MVVKEVLEDQPHPKPLVDQVEVLLMDTPVVPVKQELLEQLTKAAPVEMEYMEVTTIMVEAEEEHVPQVVMLKLVLPVVDPVELAKLLL